MAIVLGCLFVAAALVLGGASGAGAMGNAALQIASAGIIALAIMSPADDAEATQRGLLWLLGAGVGLAIVQLVPLPPALWAGLPGRDLARETLRLAGIAPGWRPLSLAPAATMGAGLAMLPALAAALIGLRTPRQGLIALYATITVVMILSALLGLTQRATGLESTYYLYAVTNRGLAVGFFANSNHLATLCALSIPIATALLVARRGATRPTAAWLLLIPIIVFALLGIAFTRSFAGLGLALVGLASIYLIGRLRRGASKLRAGITLAIGAVALGIAAFAVVLLSGDIPGDGIARGDTMGRSVLWERTIRAIGATMPVGTGLGSFTEIYPQFENPLTVTRVFANHAHNDYLETVLTGGLPALILMLAFAYWWLRTTIGIWTATSRDAFAEAATVVTGIVLLHNSVDYPLRTAAIAVVFGLCCGVMARPRRIVAPRDESERASRHVSA